MPGQQIAQQRLNAQQEARRNGRAALVALRPAQHDFGRAQRSGEIVRGETDPVIRSRHAQRPQDRWRKQRIRDPPCGPDSFVQTGTDDEIGAVHARFEQAQDLDARMAAIGRAHRDLFHRIAHRDFHIARGECEGGFPGIKTQFLDETRQRPPVFARPQFLAAQRFARCGQRIEAVGQRGGLAIGHIEKGCQRIAYRSPPFGHGRFRLGVLRHKPLDRFQPPGLARSAQGPLDPPQLRQPDAALHPAIDQRMAEQRHQRNRRGPLRHDFGEQQHEPPGSRLRQGTTGGIVSKDVPSGQMMHHAPRQSAIGRDHGDALARTLQSLAHQQGDSLRFLFGIGAAHDPDACQTALVSRQIDPRLAGFRREKQRSDRVAAFRRRGGESLAMPGPHLLARDAHPIEQQFEVILRMRHRIGARERGLPRTGRGSGAA